MTTDHAERVQAFLDAWNDGDMDAINLGSLTRGGPLGSLARADLAAVLDELKTLRPQPLDPCALVTVDGDDGVPVTVRVLGGEEMDERGHAAFGEIIRAAQRKHRDDLRREREEREADVRAVAALLQAVKDDYEIDRQWLGAFGTRALPALEQRFADRIAALDAAPQQPEHDGGATTPEPSDSCFCGCWPTSCQCVIGDEICPCGRNCPVCDADGGA